MKKPYRCSDGYCGSDDCKHCHPDVFFTDEAYEIECERADDAHNNGDDDGADDD